jgi:hypothetical protein
LIHVAGKIEDDRDVAALSCEGCATSAAQERGVEFATERDGGNHVVVVAGKDYADGDLAIVGTVGGVEGAAGGVETDVTFDLCAEFFGETGSIGWHWINLIPCLRWIRRRRSKSKRLPQRITDY